MILGTHAFNIAVKTMVDILWPVGYNGPAVCFLNKALLEHNRVHLSKSVDPSAPQW